jgi:hypothetical protein
VASRRFLKTYRLGHQSRFSVLDSGSITAAQQLTSRLCRGPYPKKAAGPAGENRRIEQRRSISFCSFIADFISAFFSLAISAIV